MSSFVATFIRNPATIAHVGPVLALGSSNLAVLQNIPRILGEHGIQTSTLDPHISRLLSNDQEPQEREAAFNDLLAALGAIQRRNENYRRIIGEVWNGKFQFPTTPPPSRFQWPPWGKHKLLDALTECLFTVKWADILETETQLQEAIRIFHRKRTGLRKRDWKILLNRATTPLEIHFLNFVRESESLSPTHWYKYIDEKTPRPENPIVKSRFGFVQIPGKVNSVISDPGQFIIVPGLWGYFDGVQFQTFPYRDDLLSVNEHPIKVGAALAIGIEDVVTINGQTAQLGVQEVLSELPMTIWPDYRLSEDNHPYKLHPDQLEPGSLGKYLVSRTPSGEYAIRFGADHHYQMLDAADIFVAGGWLYMYRGDFSGDGRKSTKLFVDGKTSRFRHLMWDSFYDNRGFVAGALLTQLGYYPESGLRSDAQDFWHYF